MSLVAKALDPLRRRVASMVGRCVLRALNDSRGVQEAQVEILKGEIRQAQRVQEYGFTSTPLAGAEGVAVSVGGNRDHTVVVATDDRRYRPTDVPAGGACIYDSEGTRVLLKADGNLEIETSGADGVRIKGENLFVEGNVVATGNVWDNQGTTGSTMQVLRGLVQTAFNAHTHPGGGPPSPQMQL